MDTDFSVIKVEKLAVSLIGLCSLVDWTEKTIKQGRRILYLKLSELNKVKVSSF